MNIAVSTLAFKGLSFDEIVEVSNENKLTIEFSSGFPYSDNMVDRYINIEIPRLLHNYFPAPKQPFVLNLASANDNIRIRSIAHCMQGLELSKKSSSQMYAAHAGFCVDPNPSELGVKLELGNKIDIDVHQKIFINSVREILIHSEKLNVSFYVENNVLAKQNVTQSGLNPLLCVAPNQIVELFKEIGDPRFGLLLDTGHLKVSAQTLGFSLEDGFEKIRPYVKAIHHNDNNGLQDTNETITDDYWFLKYMPLTKNIPHVLEVKHQTIPDIQKQIAILQLAAN